MARRAPPNETEAEREIRELEDRGDAAADELAQMQADEEHCRLADQLRQKVEELEAEVAQRRATTRKE